MQVRGYSFPPEAFSAVKCDHTERVVDTRMRTGYRHRTYLCEKCGVKRATVEVEIPMPGKGPTKERWRARLMQTLSGDACKALVVFLEEARKS